MFDIYKDSITKYLANEIGYTTLTRLIRDTSKAIHESGDPELIECIQVFERPMVLYMFGSTDEIDLRIALAIVLKADLPAPESEKA
jgi:hypothetical protein